MSTWMNGKKFNETKIPEKEEFYNNLTMEDITYTDFIHTKRVCKNFEIKHLGEHHDLPLKSDVLLLANVFGNFKKVCLKMCELDPLNFFSATALAQ